jgi:hypothetical protein
LRAKIILSSLYFNLDKIVVKTLRPNGSKQMH